MKLAINLPNILTSLRIILIPVLIAVFYTSFELRFWAAAVIFMLASFTDWLDGYLARKLGQMTPFGAFLDPVADKLIVATALVLLVELHANPWFSVPAMVIIGREIVVSALREWMAQLSDKKGLAVTFLSKIKTGFQMTAIIVFLASGADLDHWLTMVGYILLYGAALLTLWSMFSYIKLAWPHLSLGMKSK